MFVSCTTSYFGFCSFLEESIKHDFIKESRRQTNSDLAQLAEHETGDPEVVSSNPSGGNF